MSQQMASGRQTFCGHVESVESKCVHKKNGRAKKLVRLLLIWVSSTVTFRFRCGKKLFSGRNKRGRHVQFVRLSSSLQRDSIFR